MSYVSDEAKVGDLLICVHGSELCLGQQDSGRWDSAHTASNSWLAGQTRRDPLIEHVSTIHDTVASVRWMHTPFAVSKASFPCFLFALN